MTKKILGSGLAVAIALFGFIGFAGTATADVVDDSCRIQGNGGDAADNRADCDFEGEAESSADQSGSANSGDGVGGQVVGVVSAGDASVDATNRSFDVDIETGDATANNDANLTAFAFQDDGGNVIDDSCRIQGNGGDVNDNRVDCDFEGSASASAAQSANANSGDGVGGQVVGVVTSAGGSADLVLSNDSEEVDVETGDADFENTATADTTSFVTV